MTLVINYNTLLISICLTYFINRALKSILFQKFLFLNDGYGIMLRCYDELITILTFGLVGDNRDNQSHQYKEQLILLFMQQKRKSQEPPLV